MFSRCVVGRGGKIMCKAHCAGSLVPVAAQSRALRSLRCFGKSGCARDLMKRYFGSVGGSLARGGRMLCVTAPYRVTKLCSFLGGRCSGLLAVSLVYRNISPASCFVSRVRCLGREGGVPRVASIQFEKGSEGGFRLSL